MLIFLIKKMEEKMVISACGIICDSCPFYNKGCIGCNEVKGKPFWTKDMPTGICQLFDCAVNIKQYKSCGECPELPCKLFYELKDPNISEEEHQASIINRVKVLKEM
jgi:hypothetical protein